MRISPQSNSRHFEVGTDKFQMFAQHTIFSHRNHASLSFIKLPFQNEGLSVQNLDNFGYFFLLFLRKLFKIFDHKRLLTNLSAGYL